MPSPNPMHLDAGESAFFKRELEYIKTRTYDTKYKQLKGLELIPMSNEAPSGVREITYRRFTGVGFAKIISDYAKDFPRADVYGEEVTTKVVPTGISYGYSIPEIRNSQRTGRQLDQRRAGAARRGSDEKTNSLALLTNAEAGTNGLLDYSGITEYTVPADGTGSSKLWSTKTADQIVRDVTGLTNAVMNTTNGREMPDILLLPLSNYNYIATLRMGTSSDITVLQYILKTSPTIRRIEWVPELTGLGVGSTNRMFLGVFDEEHLTLEIPQPFEQFDPQQVGMEFTIPCHAETAGTIIYYPLAFAFGDGI